MTGTKTENPVEPGSASAMKRRQEIHQFKYVAGDVADASSALLRRRKRQKLETPRSLPSVSLPKEVDDEIKCVGDINDSGEKNLQAELAVEAPKYGATSVCGKRKEMEDAVTTYPYFSKGGNKTSDFRHFYGVYDGHGCSHVAMKCKDRMHEIVKNELEMEIDGERSWTETMTTSFTLMDKEINDCSAAGVSSSPCRCQLRSSKSDTVGSTAVVAVVTQDKIVVSNCGDSRAVLCRNGKAVPLSVDHKPDRPDELTRIETAGGRVIYWDGARVLGVLAMSRAIGDSYLKPFVIPEPEVTITDRTSDDECLILATDGLWDVVSNETACKVARMCLKAHKPSSLPQSPRNDISDDIGGGDGGGGDCSDKACFDASKLLTKLALSRHSNDNVSVVVIDLRK